VTAITLLTAPGRAALATLAGVGQPVWEILRQHFRPTLPEQPMTGQTWLGKLGREVGDEVVLFCRDCEPEPHVEIHCHGGPEVVRFLTELFLEKGVAEVPWQEYLLATQPRTQALATIALTRATTPRVASILLDQYRLAQAGQTGWDDLAALARWAPLGRRLLSGFRVVLAGPPNVGKSSLANALAGYQRSIVSATPGTTRDVVALHLALDGWPVELCDTAGLRDTDAELEQAGIARTRITLDEADLVVWLVDASSPDPVWPDRPGALVVVNKIDLPPAWPIPEGALTLSATTGQGLDALIAAIVARLVPEVPPLGTAIPFTPELADAALAASQHRPGESTS
jgi:tRNA modification GTPase